MMTIRQKRKQDFLQSLPIEVRECIYLFCGFPIRHKWYHTCEDCVVELVEFSIREHGLVRVGEVRFKDAHGLEIRCSLKHSPISTKLMATSRFYNQELASLLYENAHVEWMFLTVASDNEKKIVVPYGFERKRLSAPLQKKHLFTGSWLHCIESDSVTMPTVNRTLHSIRLITRLCIEVGRSADDIILRRSRTSLLRTAEDYARRLAKTVRWACLALSNLQRLTISLSTQPTQTMLPGLAESQFGVSTKMASAICELGNIRTFTISIPIVLGVSERVNGRSMTDVRHETTVDIGSLPIDGRADLAKLAISSCLAHTFGCGMACRSDSSQKYSDGNVQTDVSSKSSPRKGDEDANLTERARAFVKTLQTARVSVRPGKYDQLQRLWAGSSPFTRDTHYVIYGMEPASRHVVRWTDACLPEWSGWSVIETVDRVCHLHRR